MPELNSVGRVIIAGYEPRSNYVGTLKVTYDYHNHAITLEEAGERKEFSTGKRDAPWKFRSYIINFGGERHEDMPTEGGGRTPNPFVDFEVMVEVPEGKVQEERARKEALALGKELIPGRTLFASHAHYLPTRNKWEVLLQTEENPMVLKRVYLDADTGKEAGVGNFVPITPKQSIHMEENDIAQQDSAQWSFEFTAADGKPVLLYSDDYGRRHEYPVLQDGQDIDCGYFGIKVLRRGVAEGGRRFVDFQLGPPPPKRTGK